MRLISVILKILFLLVSIYSIYYIVTVETEKYASKSIIQIKDLSQNQSVSALGSLFLPTGSSSTSDAKLLELYILSEDMYTLLDKEFNLTKYYQSEKIDYLHRLSSTAIFSNYIVNMNNIITEYDNDLTIIHDELSNTMEIEFAHADANLSQQIVERIIYHSSKVLNRFENENSEVVLSFLEKEEKKKHQLFINSLETLLAYQNQNKTINPRVDIELKNSILAGLETELIQKNVEYNSKKQYLNISSAEMKLLNGNIKYIKKSIKKIKAEITGNGSKKELNSDMSDFMLLESRVEFNKKLYIQTLIKLEETKVQINQNSKNLIVVTSAKIPDSYSYPNKLKDSLSLLIVLSFLYGILVLIFTIIRDHKD